MKKKGFQTILAVLAIIAFAAPQAAIASVQVPQIPLAGKMIPKYVDPLPTFNGSRVDGTLPLTISMEEFQQFVLPAASYAALTAPFNGGTYVWGYKIDDGTRSYGPLFPTFTIEAQRYLPTNVTYVNNLVDPFLQKYLTVDQTLHWANPQGLDHMDPARMNPYGGPVPAVVHLHGGEVPSEMDGGPDAWFTPGYTLTGPAWNQGVSQFYTYPNTQEAATLWFHDHTLGATRLNVYAGLAGFYFLRDPSQERETLPGGDYEVEIVIQDRMFDANGQLYFPDLGINPEHPFWIPEFLGDAIVVNGKTWPFFDVEPRRYRFRFLNGSNARFYSMFLKNDVTKAPGPVFWQIGTDGGLLDAPVKLDPNDPVIPQALLMGPGERADVIIDFSGYVGQTLTLRNNARSPYPKGTAADPQTVGQIMQFRVVKPLAGPDTSFNPTAGVSPRNTPLVRLVNPATGIVNVPVGVNRQLTLNEVMGAGGPLEVLVNNTKWNGQRPDSMLDPNLLIVTETPRQGDTEVWKIVNLTADAHPIHLHLVQFQLVSRQNFNVGRYNKAYAAAFVGGGLDPMTGLPYPPGVFMPAYGPPLAYDPGVPGAALGGNPDVTAYLQGPAVPAQPSEAGWKDTVIMYPGQVTTIVARFAPTDLPAGSTQPGQNWFAFDPTTGPGYVWHCHIIDHEDNEMMRPYVVTP